jgi:hypothetical protein
MGISYVCGLWQKDQAIAFEDYLKSGVGRVFAEKRLW